MIRAIFAPKARHDILLAIQWIARDNPTTAQHFRRVLVEAAQNIGSYPLVGSERPDLATRPYRFLTPTGFPYILVYNPAPVPPMVLRVLHNARDLPVILSDPEQSGIH